MPAACYAEATEARAENQVPPRVGQYPGRRDLSVLELFASSSIWAGGDFGPWFRDTGRWPERDIRAVVHQGVPALGIARGSPYRAGSAISHPTIA